MKIKVLSFALLVSSLLFNAQNHGVEKEVKQYSENIERIITIEKSKMNQEIDELEAQFENGEISEQKFNDDKKKIAEKYEQIINQKIEEERSVLDSLTRETVQVTVFNKCKDNIVTIESGKKTKEKNPKKQLNYNDIRVGYSFMNLAKESSSFNPFESDSQMRIGNSHSVQIFFRRKRQLGHSESPWSVNYGIEYRADTYMPKKPLVFEETQNEIYLDSFQEGSLKRSKLRNVYFTLPVEFSVVLNPKYKDYQGKTYLDASKKQFKLGAGVYAGVRMRSIIKVKYHDAYDNFEKYKNVVDSGVNSFVFGGRVMLSYGGISLFLQKDFTPTFDNHAYLPNKNNVQLGIIFGSLGF